MTTTGSNNTTNSRNHALTVVVVDDVVDDDDEEEEEEEIVYNDDDDDGDDDDIHGSTAVATATTSTTTNLSYHNRNTKNQTAFSRSNNIQSTASAVTSSGTTALTTYQQQQDEGRPSSSSSTKSNKFKFWFLSEDTAATPTNNNEPSVSSSSSPQPRAVSYPYHHMNSKKAGAGVSTTTALTVMEPTTTNIGTSMMTTATTVLPKNLVQETVHKQRSQYYQSLHDIELRVSQLQADLAQETMNFDADIKTISSSNTSSLDGTGAASSISLYNHHTPNSNNNNSLTPLDLHTFLSDTSATTTNRHNDTTSPNTALQQPQNMMVGSSIHNGSHINNSNNKNWMIYEQRFSSLDAQMTHSIHVQIADLNKTHIQETLSEMVYQTLPQLLDTDQQHYYQKQEGSIVQQWESIVGIMARQYAEERASRIVSYQTILNDISTNQQQFQNDVRQSYIKNNNTKNRDEVDIATMQLTTIDPPNQHHGAVVDATSNGVMVSTETNQQRTNSNRRSSNTTFWTMQDQYQQQIRQLHQQIVQEIQMRKEQNEELKSLLLHRTELLQQAIVETFLSDD